MSLTITSCRTDLVLSFILSNSSIQHIPLSLSTNAPLYKDITGNQNVKYNFQTYVCSTSCRVSGSFVTYAVKPTALDPLPEVY